MESTESPRPRSARRSQRHAVIGLLRRNRDFRLLFLAQVVSFSGDWFLFVALAGLVFSLTRSPALVAAVYAALTVPFAVFMFVGGPLADRLNRQALMIVADVLRGFLALGFFFIHHASQVWLVDVLAGGAPPRAPRAVRVHPRGRPLRTARQAGAGHAHGEGGVRAGGRRGCPPPGPGVHGLSHQGRGDRDPVRVPRPRGVPWPVPGPP